MADVACQLYGEVFLERIYPDGRSELVLTKRNQLTVELQRAVAGLLLQTSSGLAAEKRKLGSIWFEGYDGAQPDPTSEDSGPHALSTVIAQKAIEDSARRDYMSEDGVVVEVTVLLEAEEGNDLPISFIGLYSHGTGVIPDPGTFSAGTNDVYCLARVRLGVTKTDEFTLRAGWRVVLAI